MKTTTTKSKNTPVADVNVNYIEETLKLIESQEMRGHMSEWLASGKAHCPIKVCAEIVCLAPIPLDQKLSKLQELSKHDNSERPVVSKYISELQRVIGECHNNPTEHEYYLYVYKMPEEIKSIKFQTFDKAVQYIKSLNDKADSDTNDLSHYMSILKCDSIDEYVMRAKFSRRQNADDITDTSDHWSIKEYSEHNTSYMIEKYHPDNNYEIIWFLNDSGEVLYFADVVDVPLHLNAPIPFMPGDIVVTGSNPSSKKNIVLILENEDTFDEVDYHGATCLYMNKHGNLAVDYFKFRCFGTRTENRVPVLYRAKTYTGELDVDSPLAIVSKAVKKTPALGRDIFRQLNGFQMLDSSFMPSGTFSMCNYYGIPWYRFKRGFKL